MDASDDNNDQLLRALLSDAEAEATSLELLSLIITDDTSDASGGCTAVARNDSLAPRDVDLMLLGDLTDLSFLDDAGIAVDGVGVEYGGGSGASTSALHDASAGVQRSSSNAPAHYYPVRTAGSPRAIAPATALNSGSKLKPLPSTASRPAKPPAGEKTATNTHRKRAKDELEYLRRQVQVLEQRLEGLRTQPAIISRDDDLGSASGSQHPVLIDSGVGKDATDELVESLVKSPPPPPTAGHHLWKRIAEHQLDEKQKTEVENQKLKHVLKSQLKIATSLSKLLRKRPDVSWLDSQQLGSQKKLRIDSQSGERDVFEELSERVETLFGQLDAVFLDANLANMNTELQGGIAKSDELGTMFLEVVDCKIVPFGVDTTAAALWKTISKPSMTVTNGVYQAIDVREDTLRAQYSVTLRLRRADVPIHMRVVYKRIVEASRVVLVWSCEGISEGFLPGNDHLKVRQSGWSVIEQITPSEASRGSQQAATTIMKSVLRMTPEVENTATSEKSEYVGMFTDIVLSGFHQNLTVVHQNVENLIVSELLLLNN